MSIDSGVVSNTGTGTDPSVVYSTTVTQSTAAWMSLHFSLITLSGSSGSGNESFLRITSTFDGNVQTYRSDTALEWENTTTYFNGDSVLVELLAYPGTGNNQVVIDEALIGLEDLSGGSTAGICSGDSRVSSNDPRVGRILFGSVIGRGCTAFLFNNRSNSFITAGHCCRDFDFINYQPVVEFNVPPSTDRGAIQHPPLKDVYKINRNTKWGYGAGIDWCVFYTHDNELTGLSPLVAQGDSFWLADDVPAAPPANSTIRITGYGIDPINHELNYTQRTNTGPFTEIDSNWIKFAVDASGGNSGGPVEESCSGFVYGLFSVGDCGNGSNWGTLITQTGLKESLKNPLGVNADCNGNGEGDRCDVDCGFSGGCDPGTCGQSPDCNTNGIPDECDADCNANGIPDSCDIAQATSPDSNSNKVPDECECACQIELSPVTPDTVGPANALACNSGDNYGLFCQQCNGGTRAGATCFVNTDCPPGEGNHTCNPIANACPNGSCTIQAPYPKNRFLSFNPGNPGNAGELTAIKVKLVDVPNNSVPPATERWVGHPKVYQDVSGGALTFSASALVCSPVFRDWSDVSLLNVYGEEIQPDSEYEILVILEDCESFVDDDISYSAPLKIKTGKWGDIKEPFYATAGTAGFSLPLDVLSVVDQWLVQNPVGKARTQVQPQFLYPESNVGIADILKVVDAWLSVPYPYSMSCPCPSMTTCSTGTSCSTDSECSSGEECWSGYCTTTVDECSRCIPPSP